MSAPTLRVGSKDYLLKADYNALADFEDATGQTLDLNVRPGIRGLRALLWGMVRSGSFDEQRRDAAPSLLQIGTAMMAYTDEELDAIIRECMKRDFPKAFAEVSAQGEGDGSPSQK